MGLIINIEAQRSDDAGYPLVKRGIYYCSRMISSQHGTIFDDSHYEKIRKVYSIWICENVAKKRKNSIIQYEMEEKVHHGLSVEKKSNYDLLSVIMVYMGGNDGEQQEELIRFLDVLLSKEFNLEDRKKILQDEFGIEMTRKVEGEVNEMCNLSLNIYEDGFDNGFHNGKDQMLLDNIKALLLNTGCSLEKAMEMLNVPDDKREYIIGNIKIAMEV